MSTDQARRWPGTAATSSGSRPTGPPLPVAEPGADPGLEDHVDHLADIDPKAGRRADRQVAGMFALAALLGVGFLVAYFVFQIEVDGSVVEPVRNSTWPSASPWKRRCSSSARVRSTGRRNS